MREPARGALVLLNGELSDPGLVLKLARAAGCVVCADGGARHAARLGLVPAAVVGDMDSLPKRRPRWEGTTYLCDFDEDSSDFEKTLRFVRSIGASPVWVAGAFGGRLDHTLANLSLAEKYSRDLSLCLVHEGLAWLAGPGRYAFACPAGRLVSLIPAGGPCTVSTRGLRYGLRRGVLRPGSRGLSNVALSARPVVEVHRGRVWIVQPL
jgi:thiamine pyrophosphokinase